MNLKKLIKFYKKYEGDISTVLGIIVILIVGSFIIKNYNRTDKGETIPSIGTENTKDEFENIHIVKKGEDLWNIALSYFNSGYEWKKIADANKIPAPYVIEEGQEIVIPNAEVSPVVTKKPTPTEEVKELLPTGGLSQISMSDSGDVTSEKYTVVKGDSLWSISLKVYGDGYRWSDISKANNLDNPNLIHPGNTFVIPR